MNGTVGKDWLINKKDFYIINLSLRYFIARMLFFIGYIIPQGNLFHIFVNVSFYDFLVHSKLNMTQFVRDREIFFNNFQTISFYQLFIYIYWDLFRHWVSW